MLHTANENCLPQTEEMILVPAMSCFLARLSCNATKPAFRECERSHILEHQLLVFEIKNFKIKNIFKQQLFVRHVYLVDYTEYRPFRTRSLNLSYMEMGIFIPHIF